MRILLITATYPPSANGVAISVKNLKSDLIKKGHKVLVLAPEFKGNKLADKDVLYYPSADNPIFKDYPIPLLIVTKKILKLLENFNPEIVHVHHPFHIGYFAKLIAKKFSIPVVFTYHTKYDFYAEKYFDFLPKDLKFKFLINSLVKFCNSVDMVVSPSNFIKEDLLNKGVVTKVVSISSQPSDLIIPSLSKDDLRNKYGMPKNKKILLSVSRLSLEKNIETLVRSMKHLSSDYLLVICGDGPYRQKLEQLVSKHHLESKVKMVGNIDRTEIPNYYKMADVFYYASISETQGLIFSEAMIFGLPIVATSSEASRELVPKEYGILTENDESKLAAAAKKVCTRHLLIKHPVKNKIKSVTTLLSEYSNTVSIYELSKKLLETGWQSWSISTKRNPLSLRRDFNPLNSEYLPDKTDESKIKLQGRISGWCSWYAFGRKISHQNLLQQAEWFSKNIKRIPIEYILIDEGWTRWGDWNKTIKSKFPHGMKKISDDIHERKLKSGIWIAPFLVEEESEFYKKNSSLVVTNKGRPINGINWTLFDDLYFKRYILDIRKKEVRDYVYKSIDILISEYDFDLIKLDFLYAIYFIPEITASEAGGFIRKLIIYIKTKYPEVHVIACGTPLVPVVGVADTVRVGPDTISPIIDGVPFLSKIYHAARVKSVIKNIKKRQFTSKYWNIDPDVFVCRKSLGLSESMIEELQQTIVKSNGNVFLGDDMTKLPPDRVEKYVLPLFKNKS